MKHSNFTALKTLTALLVILLGLLACNKPQNNDNWKTVYEQAYKAHDYQTALVALNHLILTDSSNCKVYYDSMALYYIKKQHNYQAGQLYVDKGLKLDPNNFNLLEYKSIFLSADGQIEDARKLLIKAYELSKLNKHLYMYATTFANEKKMEEYSQIVNGILNNPTSKPEKVEVSIDDNNSQMIELKALCYLDKAKIAKSPTMVMTYLDSALMLEPNYQEALYYKNQFSGNQTPR